MRSSGESSASSATSIIGCPEFEIARVLASLGNNINVNNNINTKHDAVTVAGVVVDGEEENESHHDSTKKNCMPWGSKGKRRSNSNSNSNNRRVKDSRPPSPTPFPFDLNLDQPSIFEEECQNGDVKVEEVCESIEPGFANKLRNNCSRSRHNLTEEEKEARRIRRILANRESARQTIRRRQAYHEELTRKAADLASENERLKRSKEAAVKEFQSLQTANQKLKGKLAQMSGIKNKGGNEASGTVTHSLHPANWSHYMYKNISANRPLVHPACVPPSDHLSQQFPWCILPCPVVLPMNGIHQLSSFENIGEGGFVDSKHVYSPSSVIHCLHSCPLVITTDKKTGPIQTQGESLNSFYQTLSGGSQTSCFSGGGLALERDDCISLHPHLNSDFPSAKAASSVKIASISSENRKERSLRKKEISVAGTEARRKRKELMKLKSRLHYHLLGRENG
ncbi:uncharacterized protein LOC130813655 [Amaranthus tricolor]|uniref:uncharacterized protein LOC130813655 n=1 Tax=Amaranthus tricolor TaxID=29722 RepID=UPI00258C14FC|nr:uncharacterized protein LOC130813655 [Amaranthus tricolor]